MKARTDPVGDFEIVPTRSIGPVRFGQTPAQVTAIMNEPQIYEDWMGGNLNDSLLFRGLILGFDRCDGAGPLPKSRLIEARVMGRPGARIFGRGFDEWLRADLVELLRARAYPLELSDHDVFVPSLGLELSFNDQHVLELVNTWKPASFLRRLRFGIARLLSR